MLANFSRRDLLRTPGLAEKYLLELLGRCSSHCDACNRQVGEPVESNRFACTATPLPRACTRVLVRSRCSFWVRQSWCCCLAVRSGSYGKRPSSSVSECIVPLWPPRLELPCAVTSKGKRTQGSREKHTQRRRGDGAEGSVSTGEGGDGEEGSVPTGA